MEPNNSMPQSAAVIKRPDLVTLICGFYFVSWFIAIINWIGTIILATQYDKTPFSFSWPSVLITLGLIVAMIGFWYMKKWGVYLYALIQVASVIYVFTAVDIEGWVNMLLMILSLVFPAAVMYIGFKYFRLMSN